jgi:hypothetical protein
MAVKLKNIKNSSDASDASDANNTHYTPPYKFGDYFLLILEILGVFILFCWTTTTNYLNGLLINTDESYPLDTKDMPIGKNPYATRFNPGPIDTSNKDDVFKKVNHVWWFECTQQSCYETFGYCLHKMFDIFKYCAVEGNATNDPIVELFSFLKWFGFGLISNIMMGVLFGLVFLMWIPGWIGGLTAFLPTTYYTASGFWKACKILTILFLSFILMCIFGFITVFPVIYIFFNFIYIAFFKQMFDNPSRFGNEFMKRMKQLIFLYVISSVLAAVLSSELPNETKYTVAATCGLLVVIMIVKILLFYKNKQE